MENIPIHNKSAKNPIKKTKENVPNVRDLNKGHKPQTLFANNTGTILIKIHFGQIFLQSAQYADPYVIKLIHMKKKKQQKNIIYNFPKRKRDGVKHTSKFEGQELQET
ncbi:UNVERIFIED_CONTAM: hypothetical protein NCL1_26374 [Trichonephila clavipes]